MNLLIRLGLDAKMLAKILNMSSGRCWSSEKYNPCPGVVPNTPCNRDYEGGFATELMYKVGHIILTTHCHICHQPMQKLVTLYLSSEY